MAMRGIAPVAMLGAVIVIVIAAGAGAYMYVSSSSSSGMHAPISSTIISQGYTSTPTTIPSGYGSTVPQAQPPLTISVLSANASFASNPNYGLSYTLAGPTLQIQSNNAGIINSSVSLYDSNGDTLGSVTPSIRLLAGKQIVNMTSLLTTFGISAFSPITTPGVYTISLKLFQNSSSTSPLYSKNFTLLAGANGTPVVQAASIKVENVKVTPYSYDNGSYINFDAVLTNIGNADLFGYYRIQVFHKGLAAAAPFYILNNGESRLGVPPSNEGVGTWLNMPAGSAIHKTIDSVGLGARANDPGTQTSCISGDPISVNVSFVEMNPTSPSTVGKILNSSTWNGTCVTRYT